MCSRVFGSVTWLSAHPIDTNIFDLTLARNFHQPTAACAHLPHFAKAMWGRPESTAFRSDKGLDVLSSTPARSVSLSPSIFGHLRALASRSGEKCGLVQLRD